MRALGKAIKGQVPGRTLRVATVPPAGLAMTRKVQSSILCGIVSAITRQKKVELCLCVCYLAAFGPITDGGESSMSQNGHGGTRVDSKVEFQVTGTLQSPRLTQQNSEEQGHQVDHKWRHWPKGIGRLFDRPSPMHQSAQLFGLSLLEMTAAPHPQKL
eukprot:5540130-Amphidinium_carterae.3